MRSLINSLVSIFRMCIGGKQGTAEVHATEPENVFATNSDVPSSNKSPATSGLENTQTILTKEEWKFKFRARYGRASDLSVVSDSSATNSKHAASIEERRENNELALT